MDIFEEFLSRCIGHKDLQVHASKTCLNSSCPECRAYYRKTESSAQIWVRRETEKPLMIGHGCDNSFVERFLKTIVFPIELILLSHEYGHYLLKHEENGRESLEKCQKEFQEEVYAWDRGQQVLQGLGFNDWKTFEEEKKKSLDGYYDGYKKRFPNFEPLKPYAG